MPRKRCNVFKENKYYGSVSFEGAVDGASVLGYGIIALVTLYWIYYSFRWPNVSEANKNIGSAIGWLWFISIVTILLSALEISNIVNVSSAYGLAASRVETSDKIIILLSGFVMAVIAYVTTKAKPFIGMIALFFAAIIYAYDAGGFLTLVALYKYVKLNGNIYTSAIIHVMALYSITKAIGACRALDLLARVGRMERLSPYPYTQVACPVGLSAFDFYAPLDDFKDYHVNLLLDTHVFLWWINGDPLSSPVLQALRKPENTAWLSYYAHGSTL